MSDVNIKTEHDEYWVTAVLENNYVMPASDIDADELVYIGFNKEWRPIIHGWLRWLAQWQAWQDASNEDFPAIDQINFMLRGIEVAIKNCEDVEDCLESSVLITAMQASIASNTTTNNTQQDTLDDLVNNPTDGNIYEDLPVPATVPACGACYYVVAQIHDFIIYLEDFPVSYAGVTDALQAFFSGSINVVFSTFRSLVAGLFAPVPPPSVIPAFNTHEDAMVEYLYCNGYDKDAFIDYVQTLDTDLALFIECITLSQWEQWVNVGATDETQDCSMFVCPSPCGDGTYDWTIEYSHDLGNLSTWSPFVSRAVYADGWRKGSLNNLIQINSPTWATVNLRRVTITMTESFAPGAGFQLWASGHIGTSQIDSFNGDIQYTFDVDTTTNKIGVGCDSSGSLPTTTKIIRICIEGNGTPPI